MTENSRDAGSESADDGDPIDELFTPTDDGRDDAHSPSLVPVVIAAVYCAVMPITVGAWIAFLLAAPDPSAGESAAHWLYGQYADRVLLTSGLAQAASGYLVEPDASVWAGSVPLMIAAVGPAIVHALVFVFSWWGVEALVRRGRGA
jgi:hypothetical protein